MTSTAVVRDDVRGVIRAIGGKARWNLSLCDLQEQEENQTHGEKQDRPECDGIRLQ
jgi:hypothetical protein